MAEKSISNGPLIPSFLSIRDCFFRPLIPGFLVNFYIPKSFLLKHPYLTKSTNFDYFVAVLKSKRSSSNGPPNVESKTWRVHVDGGRFLDGWKEFADDHSLCVGDFLVFDHLGGFVFDVLVFDPIFACGRSFVEEKTGDVEFRGEKNTLTTTTTNPVYPAQSGVCGVGEGVSERPIECRAEDKHIDKTTTNEGFKPSSHPYFRATVKQYCFKWHAMLIPTEFARLNNLAKRWCEMILIDQKGRRWTVNLRHRKTGKDQVYLASGWDEFAVANGLEVGDAMVYELLDSGSEPVMKFYKVS